MADRDPRERARMDVELGEKRRQQRRPTELRVRIYWRDDKKDLLEIPGVVRDISIGGVGIEVEKRFAEGQLLSIETSEGALQGVVRHVRDQVGHFIVGVEVLAASDGSNHLRSLENLAAILAEPSTGEP